MGFASMLPIFGPNNLMRMQSQVLKSNEHSSGCWRNITETHEIFFFSCQSLICIFFLLQLIWKIALSSFKVNLLCIQKSHSMKTLLSFFCRYVSYDNSTNLGSTFCNRGCITVQCMVVFPTVRITALTQCPYIYGHFSLHRRQSIVSSLIKAEAKAGEWHFSHTCSKGVEYTLVATKRPSNWEHEQRD